MHDWNDGWGQSAWLMMALMMFVFWAFIAAVAVYVVRRAEPCPTSDPRGGGSDES